MGQLGEVIISDDAILELEFLGFVLLMIIVWFFVRWITKGSDDRRC